MAEVGTIRVRIIADSTDADAKLKRTRQEAEKLEKVSQKIEGIGKVADASAGSLASARNLAVQSALTLGAGSLAYKGARKYGVVGGAQKAFGAFGLARATGASLGGPALMAANMIPQLKAIVVALGGLVILKKLFSRNVSAVESTNRELEQQTAILTSLSMMAAKQNRSIQELQAIQAAAADPLRRGLTAAQQRLRTTSITPAQELAFARLGAASASLAEANAALGRTITQFVAPFKTIAIQLQAGLVRTANRAGQFALGAGVQQSLLTALTLGAGTASTLVRGGRAGFDFLQRNNVFGQDAENLDRLQRQLIFEQGRGPGAELSLPPTLRSGSEEAYQFKAEQQRRELFRRETRIWQDRVLELLRRLADRNEISDLDVFRQEVDFGRIRSVD